MSDKIDFVNAAPNPNDSFINSLDTLKPDDVVPPHRKRTIKADFSANKISRLFLVLLCIAIFAYCVSELFTIVSDYGKGEDLYEDIKDDYMSLLNSFTASGVTNMIVSKSDIPMRSYHDVLVNGSQIYVPVDDGINKEVTSAKFQRLLAQLQNWRDTRNKDTYGYIHIPNTKISYPMVQCEDNDFYLKHGFDGHPLAVGAIFVDFRNKRNIVIVSIRLGVTFVISVNGQITARVERTVSNTCHVVGNSHFCNSVAIIERISTDRR